jgi:hypothetical protein
MDGFLAHTIYTEKRERDNREEIVDGSFEMALRLHLLGKIEKVAERNKDIFHIVPARTIHPNTK